MRDGIDTETKLLTRLVAEHILELTGTYPHVVTNNLRRNKLDANRHKDVASFDDPIAGEKPYLMFLNSWCTELLVHYLLYTCWMK